MITYRCPSCGKQHSKASDFEQPFQARCLRCGRSFAVTRENVQQVAAGASATRAPASAGPAADVITTAPASTNITPIPPPARKASAGPPPVSSPAPEVEADADLPGDGIPDADVAEEEAHPAREKAPAKKEKKKEGGKEGKKEQGGTPLWKRPPVIGGAVLALLVLGVGGFFLFGRGSSAKGPAGKGSAGKAGTRTASKTEKARDKDKAADKEKEKDKGEKEKGKAAEEVLKPRNAKAIRLSAARLSAELARDQAAANRAYDTALLEITGRFANLIPPAKPKPPPKEKPGEPPAKDKAPEVKPPEVKPPASYEVTFRTDGHPLVTQVGSTPAELKPWQALKPGDPITVRGIHIKDGLLRQCALLPLAPSADARYRGVKLEVEGVVASVLPPDGKKVLYPTLVLQGETNSTATVECLFPKADETVLKKVAPGSRVAVQGTGGERVEGGKGWSVRLDNCQLVDTSAPTGSVPRMDARALLREYAEDLSPSLLTAWGKEERVSGIVTLAQLNKERAEQPKGWQTKYLQRIVTVRGRVLRRGTAEVVLEGVSTTDKLKVVAHFDKHAFRQVEKEPELTVRGLCTALEDAQTLRLDNCEAIEEDSGRDPRRITADFLPHTPGRILTYDVLAAPLVGRKMAERQVWVQGKQGKVEVVATHIGPFPGKSLLESSETGAWLKRPATKAGRLPRLPLEWRTTVDNVEVGEKAPGAGGKVETAWAPVLRLGARVNDTWSWTQGRSDHTYKVVEFGEYRGRPSVVVQESVVTNLDESHPREIRHVYVKGTGEVERQESLVISSKDRKVIGERKLVMVDELPIAWGEKDKPAPR